MVTARAALKITVQHKLLSLSTQSQVTFSIMEVARLVNRKKLKEPPIKIYFTLIS
jgi:hypothetical protein